MNVNRLLSVRSGRAVDYRPTAGEILFRKRILWILLSCLVLADLPLILKATPPSGFVLERVIDGLEQPISMRFLPDGRLLLALKQGKIYIVNVSATPATYQIYMDLASSQHAHGLVSTQERGVLDLAIDPNFPGSPYVYVFYTPNSGPNGQLARVARFTHQQNSGGLSSRGSLTSEMILWEDTDAYDSCCHYGGGLDFGPDGNLWLATGDHFQGTYAASLAHAGGKVHRFRKDGTVPSGNPFVDGPGGNVDTIMAFGLRNPFRARWDLATNTFFIAEVGGNTQSTAWEDLHAIRYDPVAGQFIDEDYGTASDNRRFDGINFGWPTVEGLPPYTDWPAANIDNVVGVPLFAWKHNGQTSALNGGIVYRATHFPSAYRGAYFYADSTRDFVRYLRLDAQGRIVPNPSPAPVSSLSPETVSYPFDLDPVGRIVALDVGPDGALYYVSFTDSGGAYGQSNPSVLGSLQRYVYVGTDPPPSIVFFTATPSSGNAPLTVQFAIKATDPQLQKLTFYIDFDDGVLTSPATLQNNTKKTVSHTYATSGAFDATVYVSDGNHVTIATARVQIGTPPAITSLVADNLRSGAVDTSFRYGDTISFTAQATDPEDGTLGAAAFTWYVTFVRPGNVHPVLGPESGSKSLNFTIPSQGQGFSGNVYYEAKVIASDSGGLTADARINVYPEKRNIYFDTVPSGITVQVNGTAAVETPFVLDTLINWPHLISVPSIACIGGTEYVFDHWSNGATTNEISLVMPPNDVHLTAHFTPVGSCQSIPQNGLVLHLDAGRGVILNGGSVVEWEDQSSALHSLQAQGAPFLQTAALNGRNIVRFDGIDDALFATNGVALPGSNSNRTVIMLARYNQAVSGGGWVGMTYGAAKSNEAFGLALSGGGNLGVTGWGSANDILTNPATSGLGSWKIHAAVLASGQLRQYVDGVAVGVAPHAFATNPQSIRIGERLDGLKNQKMDVAEILVYGRVLSAAELDQVTEYLIAKYFTAGSPPTVSISSPANGSAFLYGATVTLQASASDPEDGSLNSRIAWSSNISGALGTGASLSVSSLPVGLHQITASVTDSGSLMASTSILVTIKSGTTPGLITEGLVLQVESDLNIALGSGSTVAAWLDQSGMGNDLNAAGNPQVLANGVPSGLPAISFDGQDDKLQRLHATAPLGGLPFANANRSMLVVVKYDGGSASGGVAYGTGASNQAFGLIMRKTSGGLALQGWGSANDLASTSSALGAGWLIHSAVLQGGVAEHYRNGISLGKFSHNYNTVPTKFVLGEEIAGLGFMDMDVAAVLVYNRSLTPAERAQVENYLGNKYLGRSVP